MSVQPDHSEEPIIVAGFYTEPMVRRAVREFMIRRVLRRWEIWALEALLIGFAVYELHHGQIFWSGILGGLAVLPVMFVLILWRAHWVHTVGKFRQMRTPEAAFEFADGKLIVRGSEGEAKIPLNKIVEVWRFDDFWMLFLAANNFMTLPIGQVDPSTMNLLEARLSISK